MPSSPVGSYAKDYADLPSTGTSFPAPRPATPVNAPDSEPLARTAVGPSYGSDLGAGSSGKPAPVPTQVKRFSA